MGDDDAFFFLDNLVELLGKYDHTKYVYIGGVSECVKSGFGASFEMAFGGAGFAMSYPLVEALIVNLDRCIETYPNYLFGDLILSACIADLGVPLTLEKGFHQIDLMNDISGFLSAHPQAPMFSLHHLDVTSPIFPTMDRHKSIRHLMTMAKVDQSRLLQQTVCYHKLKGWAFSIAWGYSAYVYEQFIPRSILRRPFETLANSNSSTYEIVVTYVCYKARQLEPCSNNSADYISKIRVYSPATKLNFIGNRGECCDVLKVEGENTAEVRIRACKKNEMILV
ncbi:uncharacterized protein LOC143550604 [Bidens hawaiensis]|uniref:uncharacterized protein LOC143550604 n=1 Tax=Bidens hawaiensis TaxID=980011 RepID=UPI00404B0880